MNAGLPLTWQDSGYGPEGGTEVLEACVITKSTTRTG